MIKLSDEQIKALGARIIPKLQTPAAPSELTDLLREMKKFSSAVVDVLNKPEPAEPPEPAPIVNVAAPIVRVDVPPSLPAPRRYRFTVTRRDNTAQQRIQEIIIEPLE